MKRAVHSISKVALKSGSSASLLSGVEVSSLISIKQCIEDYALETVILMFAVIFLFSQTVFVSQADVKDAPEFVCGTQGPERGHQRK